MISSQQLRSSAPVVLRFGLAAVFMWFGVSQLINPSAWVGLIPNWITNTTGISAGTFVFLNGIFEVIATLLLAIGWLVRPIALLLSLHLFTIVLDLGLTAVGVRDVGLTCAMLSLALSGSDAWCIEYKGE